jgi:acetyl esterase/lipase
MPTTPDLVKNLYEHRGAAFAEEPEMPLDRWRAMVEEWPQVTAYKWLLDQGIEPSRVAFTGDSAGGAMVVTAMLLARDRGLPLPAAGTPLSVWFDLTGSSEWQRTIVQVSDAETLLDDSRSFAERARAGRSPVADDAIRRLADWIRPHLGR